MKYYSLIIALLFALAGNSFAAEHEAAAADSESDIRAACVEAAVTEDVEEGEQFDQYVETCVQEGGPKSGGEGGSD